MTWPPADTFRQRFLYRLAAGAGAFLTVYFLLFALQTGAFLPWAICTVSLAVTLVAGTALFLMHAQRAGASRPPDPPRDRAPGPGTAGPRG